MFLRSPANALGVSSFFFDSFHFLSSFSDFFFLLLLPFLVSVFLFSVSCHYSIPSASYLVLVVTIPESEFTSHTPSIGGVSSWLSGSLTTCRAYDYDYYY